MKASLVVGAARALGVVLDDRPGHALEGMSGSALRRGRDRAGRAVVLKVTPHDREALRESARRELAAYEAGALAPVRPRLHAALVNDECTAIAIARHETLPPVTDWSTGMWLALADTIAVTHDTCATWVRHSPGPAWSGLHLHGPDRRTIDALWSAPDDQDCVDAVAEQLAHLEAAAADDVVLAHGDCHSGNALLGVGGGTILTDWQSVGMSPAAGDLAFAMSRAVPTGAHTPRRAFLERYGARRGVDVDALERGVTAVQILTLVRQYPIFMHHQSAAALGHLRRNLHTLVHTWSAGY
jgi:aminoglycoside phosphotransferase (APT) family kinase protein